MEGKGTNTKGVISDAIYRRTDNTIANWKRTKNNLQTLHRKLKNNQQEPS